MAFDSNQCANNNTNNFEKSIAVAVVDKCCLYVEKRNVAAIKIFMITSSH